MSNQLNVEKITFTQQCQRKVPLARSKFSVAVNYPHIYLFGGRYNNYCTKDFWIYNVETKEWQELSMPNMPIFENHASCVVNDKLYVLGGQFIANGSTFLALNLNRRRQFKPVRFFGNQPPNLRGHTVIARNDCIYVFGGWDEQVGTLNILWRFDLLTKCWSVVNSQGDRPQPRHNHSCVLYKDCIWIYGGKGERSKVFNDVWCYSLRSNKWSLITCQPDPPALCYHYANVLNGQMLVTSGRTKNDSMNLQLYGFSFEKLMWKNYANIEQIFGDKFELQIFVQLTDKIWEKPVDGCETFVRSVNGNVAQKSGDSGYSEKTVSQESLLPRSRFLSAATQRSMVNLAFNSTDNDEDQSCMPPGFVVDNYREYRKFASTLAIDLHEMMKEGEADEMELKEFESNFKLVNKMKNIATLVEQKEVYDDESVRILVCGNSKHSKRLSEFWFLTLKI